MSGILKVTKLYEYGATLFVIFMSWANYTGLIHTDLDLAIILNIFI